MIHDIRDKDGADWVVSVSGADASFRGLEILAVLSWRCVTTDGARFVRDSIEKESGRTCYLCRRADISDGQWIGQSEDREHFRQPVCRGSGLTHDGECSYEEN